LAFNHEYTKREVELMAKARQAERDDAYRKGREWQLKVDKGTADVAFENGKAIGREEREQESSAMLAQTVMLEGDKTKDDRIKALEAEVSKAKEKYFIERDERLKLEADKEKMNDAYARQMESIELLQAEQERLGIELILYKKAHGALTCNEIFEQPEKQLDTNGIIRAYELGLMCPDDKRIYQAGGARGRDRIAELEADKEIQATELRGKINEISVLSAKIRKLRRQPRSKKEGKK